MGTYITTPESEKEKVRQHRNFIGWIKGDKNAKLTTNIYNAKNKLVATVTNPVENNKTVQQLKVDLPQLWSLTDPYLYGCIGCGG